MLTLQHIVADHPVFAGLSDSQMEFVTGCASNVLFDPGHMLFREGEAADRFYLIREGNVALEVWDLERGPISIDTITSGDVLGWSWLIPLHRWRFDGRAVDKTRAIAMDGVCLRRKCDQNCDLGYALMGQFSQILERRLAAARHKLMDLRSMTKP